MGKSSVRLQHTIAGPVLCAGVGVHSGAHVRVAMKPAPANHGVVFVRSDIPDTAKSGDNRIPASGANLGGTHLATSLRNEAGVEVATIEHLLAACAGLEIDNLVVELDGPEMPILDGSSAPFVRLLEQAGRRAQSAPRRLVRILEPIEVVTDYGRAALLPDPASDLLTLDVTISYRDPVIGAQNLVLPLTPETFARDLAPARTFGFMSDLERMRAAGRGQGASLDNCVVIEDGRVINEGGLRFADEFARHKMLDVVGDLALVGGPIAGRYLAERPGHALNALLVRALFEAPHAWRVEAPAEDLAAAV
ncbi:MAG: UDP-3-O-acyl-N-acetylglucosamine deacetylase [Hyphomonadaceae bacterium]|nr:UDP-3-O-acyl-N-acetylglucosamine deacetylase [Hyphomonadaceae bacterium]